MLFFCLLYICKLLIIKNTIFLLRNVGFLCLYYMRHADNSLTDYLDFCCVFVSCRKVLIYSSVIRHIEIVNTSQDARPLFHSKTYFTCKLIKITNFCSSSSYYQGLDSGGGHPASIMYFCLTSDIP